MSKPIAVLAPILALGIAGAILSGCVRQHPFILKGDAKSVQVGYGTDVADALPVARKYCAQFDRAPRRTDYGDNVAYYDCVPR